MTQSKTIQYWLMKSEPDVYPWEQLVREKKGHWDGVRNHSAALNMKTMKRGDFAFFYHSNIGKEIVGIMEITKEAYPDPTDETGKFVMVDVKPVKPFPRPVTLAELKADPVFNSMDLIRLSRLSVGKVTDKEWALICKLGKI